MKALSFGEILWDVYPDNKFLGGASLNFAAHLAKHGETVFMMSAVGEDDLGREALLCVRSLGISTKYVFVPEDKQTGRCIVELDENKVPSYHLLEDVAYDHIPYEEVAEDFDVLYFGTLSLRGENNFRKIRKLLESRRFHDVFVDINIRPPFYTEDTVRFALKNATILKISLEEMPTVAALLQFPHTTDHQEFASLLKDGYRNLKCIIITLGGDGAYALDTINEQAYTCEAERVEVRSTVGAGDSFSAAFLHKYEKKEALPACLAHASRIAGFVVSQYDAVPDYMPEELA